MDDRKVGSWYAFDERWKLFLWLMVPVKFHLSHVAAVTNLMGQTTDRRNDSDTTFFWHSCELQFLLPHFDTNYRNPTAIGATQSKINTPEPSPIQHTQSISFVIRIHHDDE